jgi:hypothetical protein
MWALETPILTLLLVPQHCRLTLLSSELCIGFSVLPMGDRRPASPHFADTPHFRADLLRRNRRANASNGSRTSTDQLLCIGALRGASAELPRLAKAACQPRVSVYHRWPPPRQKRKQEPNTIQQPKQEPKYTTPNNPIHSKHHFLIFCDLF